MTTLKPTTTGAVARTKTALPSDRAATQCRRELTAAQATIAELVAALGKAVDDWDSGAGVSALEGKDPGQCWALVTDVGDDIAEALRAALARART